ncbi:MAG: hypothetical protein HY870_20695 [Chloroflexi bacterium]|nr:hypothetical protein [Chloroflexota bacterium]
MKQSLVVLMCLVIIITACGGGAAASPTPDVNALATQVASSIFATQTAAAPKEAPKATSAPKPTAEPQATDVPAAQPTPKTAGALNTPSFGDIVFAASVLLDNETPVDVRSAFPEGVTLIHAVFAGKGLKTGDIWRSEWLLDGEVLPDLVSDHEWDTKAAGGRGVWWITVYNDEGISPGDWQLNLYVDDQLLQSGTFTVEPYALGEPTFGPIVFAPDVSKNDEPIDPADVSDPFLPAGTRTAYAFFSGINMASGTEWASQWFYNDEPATDPKLHTWDLGETEQNWISFFNTDDSPLEAGVYELQLTVGDRLVNLSTFILPEN